MPDWVEEQTKRKWRWCGHVCRRLDGRWAEKVLRWMPSGGARNRGHPFTRWADDIDDFVAVAVSEQGKGKYEVWSQLAQQRESWKMLEDDYVNFCRERNA